MSDLFEIKGVDAVLKIGDREFKFADPPYLLKIKLQRKQKEIQKKFVANEIEQEDYLEQSYNINKELIKQYLPEIDKTTLDQLGEFSMLALLDKVKSLSENLFGAVVEKVEKK